MARLLASTGAAFKLALFFFLLVYLQDLLIRRYCSRSGVGCRFIGFLGFHDFLHGGFVIGGRHTQGHAIDGYVTGDFL